MRSKIIHVLDMYPNHGEMIQIVVNSHTGTIAVEHFYYDEYDVDYEEEDRYTGEIYIVTDRVGDWFKCCQAVIRNGRAMFNACCTDMCRYAKDIQQTIDSDPVLKFVSYLA